MPPLIITSARSINRPRYSAGGGGGALVDGNNATISLTSAGTKSGTTVSLKDTIEAATNGTNVYDISALSSSGWRNCNTTEGTGHRTAVSTSSPLYGTRSLACANAGDGTGTFGVSWDTGGTISDIFIRDYVRINHASTGGQWKMLRLASTDCLTDDASVNAYCSNQHGYSFDFFHTQSGNGCGAGGATTVYSDPGTDFGTTFGVWYEREIRILPSTAAAATDGRFECRFRRVSDWVRVSSITHTGITFYASGQVNRNRYLVFQNYQGNGTFDTTPSTVLMDGTWISNGDQKRVYLSTGTSWATINGTNGVERELQDIVSWSDTSITIKVRKGTLSTLSGVKAFVLDGSGSVLSDGGYTPVAA